ncbi:alpha-amylase family glycosyl hydrolase [Algoriphagus halophilus]|nr:alpha-amylase family glycosyl hydrolase [Algoriphagus halophilus]
MKISNIILVLMGVTLLTSCESQVPPNVVNYWPKAGITYEIFVQSFFDTNGDGIGDLNGVTQKLDYVSDLGANAIWLMPIMPSPSYHKYDVTDYKAIHPDYGTLEDFKNLLEEAHKRDLKVVIDLIINHTSSEHPWFLESKKGRDNPYRDYYVWAQKDTIADFIEKKKVTLDSDNIRQWHDPGDGEDFYYGFFYGGMPDLNFDNEQVRKEIFEIGKFWLEEIGVDGFRLDAAKHIYPDERAKDNHEFWKEFRSEMTKINPDLYLVGEVYDQKEVVAPFLPGLPALFNFDFHYTLIESLNKEDGKLLVDKEKSVLDYYERITSDFIDATISSNHDQPRLLNELKSDQAKYKQAIAILMSMPGAPYLYYGEEIGMLGLKPDEHIREPFLWERQAEDKGRATWIKPIYSTDSTVTPLAIQMKDESSYFHHYQELIHLRNSTPALAIGSLEKSTENYPKSIMAFNRVLGDQNLMVIHNVGKKPVQLPIPSDFQTVVYELGSVKWKGNELSLGKNASVVLSK